MRVYVRRLPAMPHVDLYIDHQPGSLVIWIHEDLITERAASLLEEAFNLHASHWRSSGIYGLPMSHTA